MHGFVPVAAIPLTAQSRGTTTTPLTETIASISIITTALFRTRALSGTITFASSITGALCCTGALSEAITPTSLVNANLRRSRPLAEVITATTAVVGSLIPTIAEAQHAPKRPLLAILGE